MTAWDEGTWSNPQIQPTLTSFINQDTFRDVILGCHEAALSPDGELFVIGCDIGEGEDIWLMSRLVDTVEDWFPISTPVPTWNSPYSLFRGPIRVAGLVLLADNQGSLHAFWNQGGGELISYTRRGGSFGDPPNVNWSKPGPIFQPAGVGAEHFDADISENQRLFVVWNDDSGMLRFSGVESAFSMLSDQWSAPVNLPIPRPGVSFPDITLDSNGDIWVVFAIPINEGRGIYLLRSTDQGQNWSQPVMVFNAEIVEWEIVDQPQLAISPSGRLHILWRRLNINPNGDLLPLELYYAFSDDAGKTWNGLTRVSTSSPLAANIVAGSESGLFRTWVIESDGRPTLFFEHSGDDGLTWSSPARVSPGSKETVQHGLVAGQNNSVSLVQMQEGNLSVSGEHSFLLQHFFWQGQRWSLAGSLELGLEPLHDLEVAIALDNSLGVLMARNIEDSEGSSIEEALFTDRLMPREGAQQTLLPSPTIGPEVVVGQTATPVPALTLAPPFPANPESVGALERAGIWSGVVFGLIVTGIVIFLVLIWNWSRGLGRGDRF